MVFPLAALPSLSLYHIHYTPLNLLSKTARSYPHLTQIQSWNSFLLNTDRDAGHLRKLLCQHSVHEPGSSTSFDLPELVRPREAQELDKVKWNRL